MRHVGKRIYRAKALRYLAKVPSLFLSDLRKVASPMNSEPPGADESLPDILHLTVVQESTPVRRDTLT